VFDVVARQQRLELVFLQFAMLTCVCVCVCVCMCVGVCVYLVELLSAAARAIFSPIGHSEMCVCVCGCVCV